MPNPLTMKLQRGGLLAEEDRRELDQIVEHSASVASRELIIGEGETCCSVRVVLSGWACRFKLVSGESRQFISLMLPGDHSPVQSASGHVVHYGICTLTACEIAEIDGAEFEALMHRRPNLARAFRWSSMTDEAILQDWLANVGRRPAERRMAHLLCELLSRLQVVALATADTFSLPLTQATFGDALGLSPAHVNRTLRSLRTRGLVLLEDDRIKITDVRRMQKFGDFNIGYLTSSRPAGTQDH